MVDGVNAFQSSRSSRRTATRQSFGLLFLVVAVLAGILAMHSISLPAAQPNATVAIEHADQSSSFTHGTAQVGPAPSELDCAGCGGAMIATAMSCVFALLAATVAVIAPPLAPLWWLYAALMIGVGLVILCARRLALSPSLVVLCICRT